jgi:hypothetical protein
MRYVEVFWAPYYRKDVDNIEFENDIVFTKPKPFFPMLLNARDGMPYLKCPAVADVYQNSYVVCAPYDLALTFDNTNKTMNTDRFGQEFFDKAISLTWITLPQGLPPLVQTTPRYIMYSFDDVELEMLDIPIINSKFSKNAKIAHGVFNISKWYRPCEVAFEVVDINKPIIMEAGEPLCMLRFHTPNNVPVKLTRVEVTPDLESRVRACLSVKNKRRGLKLNQLYELASEYIEIFKRRNK